jgi:translation initiation factor 3 subunit I
MFLTVQDTAFSQPSRVFIYNVEDESAEPVRELYPEEGRVKITKALWGPLNRSVLMSCEDGSIRSWDVEYGKENLKVTEHKKSIHDMQFSKDGSMAVTCSADQTAKLWDVRSLTLLKTYKCDRPLNSASISPLMNHVIAGGGQEAKDVTTTASKAGKFEVDFFHINSMDYLGNVKGHFGPVNSLAFAPNGKSFVSGGEDGYIRLHHFDKQYLSSDKQQA